MKVKCSDEVEISEISDYTEGVVNNFLLCRCGSLQQGLLEPTYHRRSGLLCILTAKAVAGTRDGDEFGFDVCLLQRFVDDLAVADVH